MASTASSWVRAHCCEQSSKIFAGQYCGRALQETDEQSNLICRLVSWEDRAAKGSRDGPTAGYSLGRFGVAEHLDRHAELKSRPVYRGNHPVDSSPRLSRSRIHCHGWPSDRPKNRTAITPYASLNLPIKCLAQMKSHDSMSLSNSLIPIFFCLY